jgi:hypothetical protein
MEAHPLKLYVRLVSNQGLEEEIIKLEEKMHLLRQGGAEYTYDALQLQREMLELQVRKQHPDLNPMTLQGHQALDQIVSHEDQGLTSAIRALVDANPSAAPSWGIPMADSASTQWVAV